MIKFTHIRRVDGNGNLLPTGGMTIAYTLVHYETGVDGSVDVCFNVALCSNKDLFCYQTGRDVSTQRLNKEGPLDIVSGDKHPRTKELIEWISAHYFNVPVEITLRKSKGKYRWESTFYGK